MPTHADWQLVSEASELSFVSVKAAHLAEQHHFKTVTGTVSDDGEAHLIVDLASVHTGIDIRDQRMRDMFFKVAEFPTADFYSSLTLPPQPTWRLERVSTSRSLAKFVCTEYSPTLKLLLPPLS